MLENTLSLLNYAGEIGIQISNISDFFDFGSGIFAAFLVILSLMAYRSIKMKRLLFVSAAFGLYSIRAIIDNLDIFVPEIESDIIDIATAVIGFIILGLFFIAIVKKQAQKEK